ncbi:hypothetical protein V6K52_13470 [Knoellia sp. S7-12]|uniref:hypothetical protein n=1 Tax=Knoellia sp. S7-12 TaxID=3126698 RepID=UPI0033685524
MTIHAVRHVDAPRVDLHRARAEVALTVERHQRWSQLGALGVAALQGFTWFMLGGAGTKGLMWGTAAFTSFVLLWLLGLAIDAWRDRRAGGPAAPGPSSLGQVTSHVAGHDLWVAIHAALAALGFSGTRFLDSNTVEVRINPLLRGRRFVTVRVEAAGPHGALVTVWGHPDISLAGRVYDGGLSRKDANRVLGAIPGATPVG